MCLCSKIPCRKQLKRSVGHLLLKGKIFCMYQRLNYTVPLLRFQISVCIKNNLLGWWDGSLGKGIYYYGHKITTLNSKGIRDGLFYSQIWAPMAREHRFRSTQIPYSNSDNNFMSFYSNRTKKSHRSGHFSTTLEETLSRLIQQRRTLSHGSQMTLWLLAGRSWWSAKLVTGHEVRCR